MPFIVEITEMLPGNAPEGVKRALVGVEFKADYPPTFPLMYSSCVYLGSGLRSGRVDCCITAWDAHDALIKAGKPLAASWFERILGNLPIALAPEEHRFVRHI